MVCLLVAAACGSREGGGYGGISDGQEADLVAVCQAADPARQCASYVAQLVEQLEAKECPYGEVARAVDHGLLPESERGELTLDCGRP